MRLGRLNKRERAKWVAAVRSNVQQGALQELSSRQKAGISTLCRVNICFLQIKRYCLFAVHKHSQTCCGWSFVIKVTERQFVFNLNHLSRSEDGNWHKLCEKRSCLCAPSCYCDSFRIWLCPFLCWRNAECVHTHTYVDVSQIMRVCLVDSVSGPCPLGRPCVARFCSNRFWQLCNFCWFLPDLEKLSFCSAGVTSKAFAHAHSTAQHIHKHRLRQVLFFCCIHFY